MKARNLLYLLDEDDMNYLPIRWINYLTYLNLQHMLINSDVVVDSKKFIRGVSDSLISNPNLLMIPQSG